MNEEAILKPGLQYNAGSIEALYNSQKQFFATGVTRSYLFRKGQLNVLKAAIKRFEPAILEALQKDLHKSAFESYGTEIGLVYEEINYTLKHLRGWMQPEAVAVPVLFFPSRAKIYKDPLGTVLIIASYNYPFMLLFAPLVAAIAGGNTVLLKPSENATATEQVIYELISKTFEEEYLAVITGPGHLITEELVVKHRLDHIFFTGSTAVGRKIMEAASVHLTPVTLEMGGKSPCIVAADAKLDYAAKKIAWGKWINAGQSCVAPDYLLVHASVKDKMIALLIAETKKMFGDDASKSMDYPKIINSKRYEALMNALNDVQIIWGGNGDASMDCISPCIVEPIQSHAAILQQEIFGPILPVLTFNTNEEAVAIIEEHPNPLSLYLFTESNQLSNYFINKVAFGGGCINNTMIHLGIPGLPFGGVGYSGMGQYHGKAGFDTFTRKKSMVRSPSWFDVPFWYAPHKNYLRFLKKLMN